ncbi:MAG TPA: MBL fold metallo-hydrolase [Longilinea sp.]|nr:MBL fold metallo-hydrolase [Longilinea sp.]
MIQMISCASMKPWFPRWNVNGVSLLVQTNKGPVLIDTGLGIHDYETPSNMVKFFRADFGIEYKPQEALRRQIQQYGYSTGDIKNIIVTHLHFDHAGGLPDFPEAVIHIHRREYEALLHSRRLMERLAYDPLDFLHNPHWEIYEKPDCKWFDFNAIRLDFEPEMYLIPLFGHTSGHCGVAIRSEDGWVFYCADALPTNAQFDIVPLWVSNLVLGHWVPRLQQFSIDHPEVKLIAGHSMTRR